MARSAISDILQVYSFWLMDVAPIDPLGLPIFTPLFGFSTITAPEIVIETTEITEGNFYFRRKIAKIADVSPMTLERGVTYYDSDFWRWVLVTLTGDLTGTKFSVGSLPIKIPIGGHTPRRNLMLIQYFARPTLAGAGPLGAMAQVASTAALGAVGAALSGGSVLGAAVQQGLFASIGAAIGPFEFTPRIPAKAWMLYNVIPTRYKVGTDFDANASAVSIQQLEIQPEMIEELGMLA